MTDKLSIEAQVFRELKTNPSFVSKVEKELVAYYETCDYMDLSIKDKTLLYKICPGSYIHIKEKD